MHYAPFCQSMAHLYRSRHFVTRSNQRKIFTLLFATQQNLRSFEICRRKIKDFSNDECIPVSLAFISLPNNKILDLTKLKAFADDKLKIAEMRIFLFDSIENTVGKQHFLLFPQCFPKPSSLGSFKSWVVWYRVN